MPTSALEDQLRVMADVRKGIPMPRTADPENPGPTEAQVLLEQVLTPAQVAALNIEWGKPMTAEQIAAGVKSAACLEYYGYWLYLLPHVDVEEMETARRFARHPGSQPSAPSPLKNHILTDIFEIVTDNLGRRLRGNVEPGRLYVTILELLLPRMPS